MKFNCPSDFRSPRSLGRTSGARDSGVCLLESEVSPPLSGNRVGLGDHRPEARLELRQHRARRRRQPRHPL